MRLTLDWDTEAAREQNYEEVRGAGIGAGSSSGWQLWQSSGGEGYHYVEEGLSLDVQGMFGMRGAFGDDPQRLALDRARWGMNSPHLQVLYNRKRVRITDSPPYGSGDTAELIDGTVEIEPEEQIRNPDGTIDYLKAVKQLATEKAYGSRAAFARSLKESGLIDAKRPRNSVSNWFRGDRNRVPEKYHDAIRRRARYYEIGHYQDDRALRPDEISTGDGVDRHTLIEQVPIPDFDAGDDYLMAPLEVRTGMTGPEIDKQRVKRAHNEIIGKALNALSAGTYEATRYTHGLNVEDRQIDRDEANAYLENFAEALSDEQAERFDPNRDVAFHLVWWESGGENALWEVLGYHDGETGVNRVARDSQGWF